MGNITQARQDVQRPVATGHQTLGTNTLSGVRQAQDTGQIDSHVPTLRTQADQQLDAAIEELDALTRGNRGLGARRSGPDQVTLAVGGVTWPARVIARSSVSAREVQELIATEARGSKIIVARQISSEAKDLIIEHNRSLRSFGWSWLDRS